VVNSEAWDLASFFGYAGVVANIGWLVMRRRKYLLVGQVVACVLMFGHFFLLSAYTGAIVMLVAGTQVALAIPLESHPKFKTVYLASLILTPIVCLVSWQGIESAFSSLALALVSVANFQLKEVRQRVLLLMAILAWVTHNGMVGSIPALVSNGLAIVVSAHMLARALRLDKHGGRTAW